MGILFSVIGALIGAIIVYIIMRGRQEEVKQINRAQLEAFDKEVQEKKIRFLKSLLQKLFIN